VPKQAGHGRVGVAEKHGLDDDNFLDPFLASRCYDFRLVASKKSKPGGIAPVSKENGKYQPLRALCLSLARYRLNRLFLSCVLRASRSHGTVGSPSFRTPAAPHTLARTVLPRRQNNDHAGALVVAQYGARTTRPSRVDGSATRVHPRVTPLIHHATSPPPRSYPHSRRAPGYGAVAQRARHSTMRPAPASERYLRMNSNSNSN